MLNMADAVFDVTVTKGDAPRGRHAERANGSVSAQRTWFLPSRFAR